MTGRALPVPPSDRNSRGKFGLRAEPIAVALVGSMDVKRLLGKGPLLNAFSAPILLLTAGVKSYFGPTVVALGHFGQFPLGL
jgi:hypothetical protein